MSFVNNSITRWFAPVRCLTSLPQTCFCMRHSAIHFVVPFPRSKMQKKGGDDDQGPTELLEKPKEYLVKFRFPETSQLQPPILGLYNASFNYEGERREEGILCS